MLSNWTRSCKKLDEKYLFLHIQLQSVMSRIKLYSLFLWLVFVCWQARAQEEYLAEPFMPETPLCSATVGHILQDSKGFMWFGTPDGVDRYDGYQTLHIPFPEGDSGYGNVRTLCEDNDGNIWIGSYKGICVWNAREQRVKKYSQTGVARIVKSRDGALWVAANYGGFLKIDPETGVCDTLRFSYHNASAHFGEDVAYDGDETVWFLNGVGAVYRCSLDSKDLETVVSYEKSPLHSRGVTSFHYLDGLLLAGTGDGAQGLFSYDTRSGDFAYFDQEDSMDELLNVPILMMDDLGSEPLIRNITVELLFNLINERQSKGLSTVVSTNLTLQELRERYTERVASRLNNPRNCLILTLAGKDLRKLER